jgi:hypothetical protein
MLADVAFGSKADMAVAWVMSAIPPTADKLRSGRFVRYVPIGDIGRLLNQFVSASAQVKRDRDPKRFCGFKIDQKFDLGGLEHWEVGRFIAL